MKHLFLIFAVLLASIGLAAPTYHGNFGTERSRVDRITEDYVAKFALDATIDSGGVAYSIVYDIAKLPIEVGFDSGGVMVQNLDGGDWTFSCFDSDDETGDDSVNVKFLVQGADYAADNSNPSTAKSDAWYPIDSTTVFGVSNTQTIVEGTVGLTLPDEAVRFLRIQASNLSTAAINVQSRCKAFWTRKVRNR